MMIYIENGIHDQILEKNVGEISHPTVSTTVKWDFNCKKIYIYNIYITKAFVPSPG